MLLNKLVKSDGSVIDSSVIISCEYSEEVNNGGNLSVGDVTSSEISVELLRTAEVKQGEMLTYYIIEDDVEILMGQFKVDRPTFASRTTIKFSAYDNVAKAEKLFSDWLVINQDLFSMTLLELVQHACDYCGLTLATTDFPHAGMSVHAFTGDNITCRQILGWAAAIAGRFVRANPNGEIEFAWYSQMNAFVCAPVSYASNIKVTDDGEGNIGIICPEMTVSDDGDGNVIVDIPGVTILYDNGNVSIVSDKSISYFLDGVSYESYATDTISMVRINRPDSELGITSGEDGNCFTISDNAILNACGVVDALAVAGSLHTQLKDISYVPAKIRVPRTTKIRAGDIIRFYTPVPEGEEGKFLTTYVMRMSINASGTSLESTGDKSYGESQTYAVASTMSLERPSVTTGLVKIDGNEFTPSDYTLLYIGLSASATDPVCCVAMPAAEEMTFRVADGSTWTLSSTGLTGDGNIRYIYGWR